MAQNLVPAPLPAVLDRLSREKQRKNRNNTLLASHLKSKHRPSLAPVGCAAASLIAPDAVAKRSTERKLVVFARPPRHCPSSPKSGMGQSRRFADDRDRSA